MSYNFRFNDNIRRTLLQAMMLSPLMTRMMMMMLVRTVRVKAENLIKGLKRVIHPRMRCLTLDHKFPIFLV